MLVDCLESGEEVNSIQRDHAFAAETACNYLISQNRRQIALIHPEGMGFADQVLLGYKHALEKISCLLTAIWSLWTRHLLQWRCRNF